MDVSEVRYLFGYDRWATQRILARLDGTEPGVWTATDVVGDRGLGSILVHMLGSHQRWHRLFEGSEERPRPELEPLPTPSELAERWIAELDAFDGFLDGLTPRFLTEVREGLSGTVMLLHLANHGTQHRSEAALLLTQAGRSPGDLDLMDYAELQVADGHL